MSEAKATSAAVAQEGSDATDGATARSVHVVFIIAVELG